LLVLTVGRGTHCFTLDREQGSFMLTRRDMQVPPETKEFAINVSNQRHWFEPMQRYVADLLAGKDGPRGKDFNMRWVASMVADVHRILTRGGVFIYPADRKDLAKPGRLRLMYEANPMAFIVEQAGGAASTGSQRMLDVQPTGCTSACRWCWVRARKSRRWRATTPNTPRKNPARPAARPEAQPRLKADAGLACRATVVRVVMGRAATGGGTRANMEVSQWVA
jgi:hypothetical protein